MSSLGKLKFTTRALFTGKDPLQVITDGKGFGECRALHKECWEGSPQSIWNDFIASEIGYSLRLPIPACALTEWNNRRFFSSLDFNWGGNELPPIEPDFAWEYLPDLCTGVLLFDILIANNDRHDKNLCTDKGAAPTLMRVFDHDQALLGGNGAPRGIERLNVLRNRLGIGGSRVTGGSGHCLLPVIDSQNHFPKWVKRIYSIPPWFIQDLCDYASDAGMNKA